MRILKKNLILSLIFAGHFPFHACAEDNFKEEFSFKKIRFTVEATNKGSINQLTITPAGLTISNEIISRQIDGTVTGVRVLDIDNNGFPEVYVWFNSAGSGSYGDLIAYAVNKGKSMTEVYFPPLQDNPENTRGYMGHDEFEIVEASLVRRFPLYKEGDSNSKPSGKMRQLQYKLVQGEAGW
ncbi:MAG: PliI family lysozyme inhibitor of I-type lysozyme, partial [Hyphomicrobium sp.]